MHLCNLPATEFPTLYYFAEKFVHSRNIILYEAHILSENKEKEKKKKKRKCNAFHVIWILVNEKNVRHGQRECMRAESYDDVTQFAIGFKITWFLMKQNPIVRLLIRRNTTNIIPHESVQFCFTS